MLCAVSAVADKICIGLLLLLLLLLLSLLLLLLSLLLLPPRVLSLLPVPLPGLTQPGQVAGLVGAAGRLLLSPRLREADAGGWVGGWGEEEVGSGGRVEGEGAAHVAAGTTARIPTTSLQHNTHLGSSCCCCCCSCHVLTPPPPTHTPGARLLQLLFQRYTLVLGWALAPYPSPAVTPPVTPVNSSINHASKEAVHAAVLQLLWSLTGQLQAQVAAAKQDLGAVARQGFVHGVLLGLRYIVELVPWSEMSVVNGQPPGQTCGQSSTEGGQEGGSRGQPVAVQLQQWVGQLVALLQEVVGLTGPQLSQQDLNVAAGEVDEDLADMDGDLDEDFADLEADGGDTASAAAGDSTAGELTGSTAKSTVLGPAVQVLITCSWTSVKELAFMVGTLARCLPLPGEGGASMSAAAAVQPMGGSSTATGHQQYSSSSSTVDSGGDVSHRAAGEAGGGAAAGVVSGPGRLPLLSPDQLRGLGESLVGLLLTMKHNGAVDKTQLGLEGLAGRLLGSGCPQLAALPGAWLQVRGGGGRKGGGGGGHGGGGGGGGVLGGGCWWWWWWLPGTVAPTAVMMTTSQVPA
jgi:hypothetical protein